MMPGNFNLLMNQPLFQITLAKEGEPDKILTLGPLNLLDHLTVVTMERASQQPIDQEVFQKLAAALHIELTEQFKFEVLLDNHWYDVDDCPSLVQPA
jgi:hypothetical protein